ncbi:Tetratricopeptide TPR_2 repeat-containing protein [Actinobacteria bacterium OK074]|nr:Tetratricopeptide TPR_2 repeat-containing protein [Actinobacteria bacterium OK074]
MENEPPAPPTSAEPVPDSPGPRRSRRLRWVLVGSVVGCLGVGGTLLLFPPTGADRAVPPAPGPVARAATAVGAGVPAALPDLAALVADRETYVRLHPRDARAWTTLGAAYVEQGGRTGDPSYYVKAERALRTALRADERWGGRGSAAHGGDAQDGRNGQATSASSAPVTAVTAVASTPATGGRPGSPSAASSSPSAPSPSAPSPSLSSLSSPAPDGPRNADALVAMAALADARADYRAAKEWGRRAVKAVPKRWSAYPALIEAYDGLGDYKAARRTLDTLLELRADPTTMTVAAGVYRDRGWREDAAATLADAAARAATPAERAEILVRAGELAWERGDAEQSLRYGEAAVRTDPDAPEALAGQARALAALGRTSEAVNAYRAALVRRPSAQYALELGELYEALGLGGPARVQYDLVRERVRVDAAGGVDDAVLLGQFEAEHGDVTAAVRGLREEWQRQPGIRVADALGWALHRAGQDKEALKFATRVMDREHGGGVRSALYAYHRAEIERALGRTASARRHLEEALRINPYFSVLRVPAAEQALAELGEPPNDPLPQGNSEEEED